MIDKGGNNKLNVNFEFFFNFVRYFFFVRYYLIGQNFIKYMLDENDVYLMFV